MANPIRTSDVRRVLQPILGTRFVSETPLCDRVTDLLRRYSPGRATLQDLSRQVWSCLFDGLYQLLGNHMTVQLDNGVYRRILMAEVDRMADDAMGVLLEALSPAEMTLPLLRDYAMSSGSLSAMRLLLSRHGEELSGMEADFIRRILRENSPATGFERPVQ